MKEALLGLAVIVAVVLIAGAAIAFDWWTAPFFGKLEARHQIYSGSNRIAQYDKFFNACASIQTLENQLDSQQARLQEASATDRGRILDNIAGIQGLRATAINQYNADAAKNYTDGQFRDSDLPYKISLDGRTKCAY